MPAEKKCTWLGTGPAMKIHWDRFWWNVKNIFRIKTFNPYVIKDRPGYIDIFYSMVNISVEFCRACPYRAGHILFWENVILIIVFILVAIGHVFLV